MNTSNCGPGCNRGQLPSSKICGQNYSPKLDGLFNHFVVKSFLKLSFKLKLFKFV